MVTRGRNICNTLKAIRKQIADANGINYSPEECHFEGECKGTCPKCEQDVRDLEYELHLRQMTGKAIKVAGVALGITALAASATSCATQKGYYKSTPSQPEKVIPIHFRDYTSSDSVLIKEKEELSKQGVLCAQGHIIEEGDKQPVIGAIVTARISEKQTMTDIDGNFTIEVEQGDTITVKFIGYQDRIINLSEMNQNKLNIITLTASGGLAGEIVVVKTGKHSKKTVEANTAVRGTAPVIKRDALPEEPKIEKQSKKEERGKQENQSKQDRTTALQPAIAADSTDNSKIFGAMEEMASFPGGVAACMKYIADNLRAPKECLEGAAAGRVILGFTVNEDGSLSDIKVMRSITPALDKEAIRVVKSMPKWNPAKQNGKPVKTKYTLPVVFHWQ